MKLDTSLRNFVSRWVLIGFAIRVSLMLLIHFSNAEKELSLTKDAFLYDNVGVQLAQYLRTGDPNDWPVRLAGVIDFGWEYLIGGIYYLIGHQPLVIKSICVLASLIASYVHFRIAYLVTGDDRVARLVLVLSILFPTQVYYSTLMVRDSVATLGVSLIFLGVVEYVAKPMSSWFLHLSIGFVIVVLLRSYLAAILAATIPLGFVAAALVGGGGAIARGKAALGFVLLGGLLVGVVGFAPELVAEVDTQFTDLSYINKIRNKMNTGSGAFYSEGQVTEIGEDFFDTTISFAVGIYFFFFSINPGSINTIRQVMALPEVLLVAIGAFYSIRGARVLWYERRYLFTVLLVPTIVITFGYSVATTNGGPLMRWRMQLMGIYLVIAATGLLAARVARVSKRQRKLPGSERCVSDVA